MNHNYHRKGLGRFLRRRGHGLVEFALVLPLFFLLIFAIIDLAHLYFVKVTIENAVRQAGRFAVTGAHLGTSSRVDSIRTVAQNAAPGLGLDQVIISSNLGGSNQVGTSTANNLDAAGGPGDTVTIELTTHLSLFTPMIGKYFGSSNTDIFAESVTFRNEQFSYNQTQ